jgi:hypothetical protein
MKPSTFTSTPNLDVVVDGDDDVRGISRATRDDAARRSVYRESPFLCVLRVSAVISDPRGG